MIENHWDARKQRAKLSTARGKEYEVLNQDLDRLERLVLEFRSLNRHSVSLDKAKFKAHLMSGGEELATSENQSNSELFDVWRKIIDSKKNSAGLPITNTSRSTKLQTLELVKSFASKKALSLTLQDLDMVFYREFDEFMIKKGLSGNTRGKHFKEIKATLREAIDRDYKVNLAFQKKSFKVIRTEPEKIFLNEDDLKKIMDVHLSPRLNKLRDIFIMASFVGARHSDWHQIKPENISVEKGKEILKITQQKTSDVLHIPVHPVVRMILTKYGNLLPKVISNQKFNEALKEICQAADLGNTIIENQLVPKWMQVSTHTARRSFATNAYLSRSMDVYQIMKCTGHKTEASFLRYLKLSGKDFAIQAADSSFFTNTRLSMNIAS